MFKRSVKMGAWSGVLAVILVVGLIKNQPITESSRLLGFYLFVSAYPPCGCRSALSFFLILIKKLFLKNSRENQFSILKIERRKDYGSQRFFSDREKEGRKKKR